MKTILLVLAGLCLPVFSAVAQTLNHPVIEKVQVLYKPDKSVSNPNHGAGSSGIKVNGTTIVTLKNDHDANRVSLKIKDKQTQAVVYTVSYAINSADVTDRGMLLYRKQGAVFSITNPTVVALKPYVYELYTEDAAGNKSSVYTIIQ